MTYHIPVLLKESLEYLSLKSAGIYVDATLGGGGHTEKLKAQNSKLKVYGFDQDEDAIAAAKERLKSFDNIVYIQDNFRNLKKHIQEPIDGILFDLGISSHQIDVGSRGFSINHDGPLDMRMDKNLKLTAEDIVNHYSEKDLQRIFKEFGEERFAHRIAAAILHHRKQETINSTFKLKIIVEKAIPTWKKRESVSRIFQALRIAVNCELDCLKAAIADAIDLLKPGGRIVVLSYHSLEDRMVKHALRQEQIKVLTKKPVMAGAEEMGVNPRSKSAKLRAGEKL